MKTLNKLEDAPLEQYVLLYDKYEEHPIVASKHKRWGWISARDWGYEACGTEWGGGCLLESNIDEEYLIGWLPLPDVYFKED